MLKVNSLYISCFNLKLLIDVVQKRGGDVFMKDNSKKISYVGQSKCHKLEDFVVVPEVKKEEEE